MIFLLKAEPLHNETKISV